MSSRDPPPQPGVGCQEGQVLPNIWHTRSRYGTILAGRRLAMTPILFPLLVALLVPQGSSVAPVNPDPQLDPSKPPGYPPYVQQVQPAVVGIRARIPLDRPSVLTLGPERWGSGVIFDPSGYALTVSYVLLDAATIQVSLRDGRVVPATLVGLDLESGLGVIKLEGDGPWPSAP